MLIAGQNAEVPQEWSVMKASDFVTVVPVTPADSEYQSVAQNFTSTLQQAVTIVKVNQLLWHHGNRETLAMESHSRV